jgi:hypothetical protein
MGRRDLRFFGSIGAKGGGKAEREKLEQNEGLKTGGKKRYEQWIQGRERNKEFRDSHSGDHILRCDAA